MIVFKHSSCFKSGAWSCNHHRQKHNSRSVWVGGWIILHHRWSLTHRFVTALSLIKCVHHVSETQEELHHYAQLTHTRLSYWAQDANGILSAQYISGLTDCTRESPPNSHPNAPRTSYYSPILLSSFGTHTSLTSNPNSLLSPAKQTSAHALYQQRHHTKVTKTRFGSELVTSVYSTLIAIHKHGPLVSSHPHQHRLRQGWKPSHTRVSALKHFVFIGDTHILLNQKEHAKSSCAFWHIIWPSWYSKSSLPQKHGS